MDDMCLKLSIGQTDWSEQCQIFSMHKCVQNNKNRFAEAPMLQYSWVSATSGVVQCGVWAVLDTSSMMHHPAHCTIRYLPTQILKSEHLLSTVYLLSIYYLSTFYYILSTLFKGPSSCNPDAKRLFDDLLSSYNKLVRPVMNVTDAVTVKFKLKLSQLIDVVSVLLKYSALDIFL